MPRLTTRKSDRVVPSTSRAGKRRAKVRARRPAQGRSRRRRWVGWLAPLGRRRSLAALALLGLAGGAAYGWASGLVARALAEAGRAAVAATADAGLVVREILVEGRVHAPPEALRAALGVGRGDPLLAVDAAAVRARLEALGWVRRAAVERRLPDMLYVRLVERRPVALWQHRRKLHLVDSAGTVITDQGLEAFARLPLVVGDGAPQALPALLRVIAGAPELARRLSAAVRVGGRRWNLRFDDRVDVKLPEQDIAQAWARLVALQRDEQVLDRAIAVLDLRREDRVVVRAKAGAAVPAGDAPRRAGKGSDA
ncbi:MAG TPA: cell division protein FtsQ/DivIB [Alphaproteobacteria bacterium]